MHTTLHPATHALATALGDDPFYRAISVGAGSDAAQRQQLLQRYFDLALQEAQAIGEVHTHGALGAALWTTPEAGPAATALNHAQRTAALQPLLGAAGFAAYTSICASMAAQVPAAWAKAWYLSILGVAPVARGQGLAQRLLAPTLERADGAGAHCFLETFNPLSLPLYARLGFVVDGERQEPWTQRPYWLLVRPPRTPRSASKPGDAA